MASRPRRSAATKANESISVHAKWADASERSERSTMSSRRSGRTSGAGASRDLPSSPDESVTVKTTSRSTRGANRRSDRFDGGEIVHGTRNRGGRKNYVIDSSPDEEEEEDAEGDDVEDADEDAEGDMEVDAEGDDIDAEGEEDAEGDIDMDAPVISRTIRVSQPAPRSAAKVAASKMAIGEDEEDEDEDDDDELSDPVDSDEGEQTMGFGDETMADEDAEGEEIEVAGEDEEEEEEEEEDEDEVEEGDEDAEGEEVGNAEAESDGGTREGTPDLTKMTKRQRARFEEEPQEYMKLSDEVQVKKHFTAEELSMRRQEMARRRRNLSEKRNEEVKMETINKLLKKQAPKINRKAAAAAARADSPTEELYRPDPTLIRWVNNKNGSRVSVPADIMTGPAGQVFSKGGGLASGKMVEEVA
ncbi:hypothetical protein H634G_01478 [Metarhizium anisopliae BRIP 53293]|uniref:INO80 complex subunit B-like conserved region domain-containing protein n=1 Tax=Metarhizium anisopliae BRIP 53293 TaxID=1291518 RepID=A0A0D9PAS8_METAN|nr:hypothetical protein H634G_01478 [Metarhizium anisopliae BRIP 53293]KJK91004.1 hypothetical protein H633G_05137 [Metarhizium anisopliae BRIP 53284]